MEVDTGRRLGPKVLGCALAIVVVALACQDTTGVHWVDSLSLKPDSLYLVPGESLQFGVVPLDQHDLPLPERAGRVEWNLSNPDVAVIETTETGATITGVAPGGTFVRVELGPRFGEWIGLRRTIRALGDPNRTLPGRGQLPIAQSDGERDTYRARRRTRCHQPTFEPPGGSVISRPSSWLEGRR